MPEFSEGATPNFSKLRFTSLHDVQSNEQINQNGHHTIAEREEQDVLVPKGLAKRGERNGNGHRAAAEREKLEVLNPTQPGEQGGHNGHLTTADVSEIVTRKFSIVRFAALQDVQQTEPGERNGNGHYAAAEREERDVLDPQQPGEQGERNGHQTIAKPKQLGFLDSRGFAEREENIEHQTTAKLKHPGFLDLQQPGKRLQNIGYSTPGVQRRGILYPQRHLQRPGKLIQNYMHTTLGIAPLNGTQKLSTPARSFNQMRLASALTATTKHMAVAPATRQTTVKPAIVSPRVQDQERVKFYTTWLARQAEHDRRHNNAKEINDYVQEAAKIVKVGEHEVAIFAPFRPQLSALQTFTTGQVIALYIIGLLWIIGLLVFRLEMLTAVIGAITVMYTFNLILSMSMATRTFRNTPEERISDDLVQALKDADWPLYTILCPLYKEAQVVPQFVQAMLELDYPPENLQILFLTEEDDVETRNAIRALSLPSHFKILVVPDGKPRTKPRACNYGLMHAKGPFVVIYDAEDIPDPLQLKKAVLTFASHGTDVICVQAKLNFYNIRQNILTRWFTAEYSAWFDLILPGLQLAKFFLPLGGTSNHFRTAALRALGGWDAYNVTEDCDLGLRLKRYRMNTVILDSTTLEEANSQLKNWLRQRSRWIKGYMQTYLVHMRNPLQDLRKGRLYDLFSFQIVIGIGIGVMFINPLMWILLGIYIVFGSSVINVYHILFPSPILYLSAFCLIFGNFFYVYLYLLACSKRKLYHLLPWALFIPFYWLLMSTAAFYALFELLVKPHYWQKTVHGLHLKGKYASTVAQSRVAIPSLVNEPTMPVPVLPRKVKTIGFIPSITMSLKAIPTLLMPAISPKQKQAQRVLEQSKVRDLWLLATIITACITSIVACWYYFHQHEILLYGDALSHMRIARSVFDSATPGLAQLGSVWLPLPHILMWPFIWNNFLWQSGLAGSFVSMPCYVITSVYLFLSARKLTRSSSASFIGTLVFIFNPNVLYLQSTPLSETVCIATFTMSCFYLLSWVQEGSLKFLIFTAICTFLATLARYDGWFLFLAISCIIPLVGWKKHQRLLQIQGNLILFGFLGSLGIILWFIWNQLIFGDAFYFQHGTYSSQAQQLEQLAVNRLYTYHDAWQAVRFYSIDSIQTIGLFICVLAIVAFVLFVLRYRFTLRTFGASAFLVPFVFYIIALYVGQAIIWVPGANPPGDPVYMYNVRYGVQMVVPIALFVAILVNELNFIQLKRFRSLGRIIAVGVIILQSVLITSQGIISLQEGLYGYSCHAQPVNVKYLAEHYNGGKILEEIFTTQVDPTEIEGNFKNFIYEGSGQIWLKALHDPASSVDWVLVNPDNKNDLVAHYIDVTSPLFLSQFVLVSKQTDGVLLFHRIGGSHLASRNLPPAPKVPHPTCL